jgi:hypothetical protein
MEATNEANIKISVSNEQPKAEPKFKEWDIDDAVRTLTRAEEIRQNAELMAFVVPKLEAAKKAAENAYANVLYAKKEEIKQ